MKPIVADSSPLIALARIGQLALTQRLFDQVWLPPAVAREIVPQTPKPGVEALANAAWLTTQPLQQPNVLDRVSTDLGVGEREAIALALERNSALLLDDAQGRREAQRLGVPMLRTIGLLIEAKAQGAISEVKPLLDVLLQESFYLSKVQYQIILNEIDEG